MRISGILLTFAVALQPFSASGASTTPITLEYGARVAAPIARWGERPAGFGRIHTDPPFGVFARTRPLLLNNGRGVFDIGFYGDASAEFMRAANPFVGAGMGAAVNLLFFEVDAGFELNPQGLLFAQPHFDSPYSATVSAWVARAKVKLGPLIPAVVYKSIGVGNTTLSTYESMDTKIAHAKTTRVGGEVGLNLLILRASAGMDVYMLGRTGIASSHFAYSLAKDRVVRYRLGAGIGIGKVEVWVRAARVLDVEAPREHNYRAPMVSWDDYLLSPTSAAVEVKIL